MTIRNKARKEDNTTISVSMSKELKCTAQRIANERGIQNVSALIRMLLVEETKTEESKNKAGDDPGHFQRPTGKRPVGVSGFTLRK